MSLAHPILFPGDKPDGFEPWLRRVAVPIGNCETTDGRVLEMHATKAALGQIHPGSNLSRRTLRCVFDAGNASQTTIPAKTAHA